MIWYSGGSEKSFKKYKNGGIHIITKNEHDKLVAENERLNNMVNGMYEILHCEILDKTCNTIDNCNAKNEIGCYKCDRSYFVSSRRDNNE